MKKYVVILDTQALKKVGKEWNNKWFNKGDYVLAGDIKHNAHAYPADSIITSDGWIIRWNAPGGKSLAIPTPFPLQEVKSMSTLHTQTDNASFLGNDLNFDAPNLPINQIY